MRKPGDKQKKPKKDPIRKRCLLCFMRKSISDQICVQVKNAYTKKIKYICIACANDLAKWVGQINAKNEI